jgi:uncharacterized protein YbjT (DUF2867 family)
VQKLSPTSIRRVLVVGASGGIGGAVVTRLLDDGVAVRALTRNPERAAMPARVDVAVGDLTIAESLDAALRDVDAVFVVWTAPPESIPAVIGRIAESTQRLVFLSSPHQTPHPFFLQPNPMARLHAAIESAIVGSGVPATILRPGMFASNTLVWWAAQIRSGDVVRWPYAAAVSAPIDERDIAAVAAHALADESRTSNDYVLTGRAALTHAEQVSVIGDVLGRRLTFEELTPNDFRESVTASGVPLAVADMLLNAWAASVGIPAYMTSTVLSLTGRPARSFREWVTDHADQFR